MSLSFCGPVSPITSLYVTGSTPPRVSSVMWMEVKVFIRNVIYTLYVKLYVKDPMWLVSVSNEPSKIL